MHVVKILDYIDSALVVTAIVAIVTMMTMITVSVIGRYFFSLPIPGDLVMSEFLMVFVVFLPMAAVQAKREHVFVTFFTDWMKNDVKVVMETFGVIVGCIIFTLIAAAVYSDFAHAWDVGAYTEGEIEFPEAPPRFIVFVGLALFALRLFVDSIQSVYSLITHQARATQSETDRVLEQELSE